MIRYHGERIEWKAVMWTDRPVGAERVAHGASGVHAAPEGVPNAVGAGLIGQRARADELVRAGDQVAQFGLVSPVRKAGKAGRWSGLVVIEAGERCQQDGQRSDDGYRDDGSQYMEHEPGQ